jgi:hypothetical protein
MNDALLQEAYAEFHLTGASGSRSPRVQHPGWARPVLLRQSNEPAASSVNA